MIFVVLASILSDFIKITMTTPGKIYYYEPSVKNSKNEKKKCFKILGLAMLGVFQILVKICVGKGCYMCRLYILSYIAAHLLKKNWEKMLFFSQNEYLFSKMSIFWQKKLTMCQLWADFDRITHFDKTFHFFWENYIFFAKFPYDFCYF